MTSVYGQNGLPGFPGVTPGGNGGNGKNGSVGNLKLVATAPGVSEADTFGGSGGNGGAAGDGGYITDGSGNSVYRPPGAAGAGGNGALGDADDQMLLGAVGLTQAIANATGGAGGDAGNMGATQVFGLVGSGNAGGNGGAATATAIDINPLGSAYASATSTGGNGGSAVDGAYAAGAAGNAFGTRATADAGVGDATAIAKQYGGAGGSGLPIPENADISATPKSGAFSSLVNAVAGQTNGATLTLSQQASGGTGGATASHGQANGGGAVSTLSFDDTKNTTQSAAIDVNVAATGGAGGGSVGIAGGGNGATGRAAALITGAGSIRASATATGGDGGGGGDPGNGGNAWAMASAISSSTNAADSVSATATAQGGQGNLGGGALIASLNASGVYTPGVVDAVIAGAGTATAKASVIGGYGGGNARPEALVNQVAGETDGGALYLTQTATGGAGTSGGAFAGHGGGALSDLAFDDTQQADHSAAITAFVSAEGGAGGYSTTGANNLGGNAKVVAQITGEAAVNVTAAATGGQSPGGGYDGAANATATATGDQGGGAAPVISSATASGGSAIAVASSTGSQLLTTANAATTLGFTVSESAMAQTSGASGELGVEAETFVKAPTPVRVNATQAGVAVMDALPAAGVVAGALAGQPLIDAAFAGAKEFYGFGEIGGFHGATGADTQTSTETLDLTLSRASLHPNGDLIVALFNGYVVGDGLLGMSLNVTAVNDATFQQVSFEKALDSSDPTLGADASLLVSDDPIDLGSLTSGGVLASAPSIDVRISLSVTTDAAKAGADCRLLIGDPPGAAATATAAAHPLAPPLLAAGGPD